MYSQVTSTGEENQTNMEEILNNTTILRQGKQTQSRLIVFISNYVPRLFRFAGTCRYRRIPFRSSVCSGVHFHHIAVDDGGSIGSVPPRVSVQVNETKDESVHQECGASREAGSQEG